MAEPTPPTAEELGPLLDMSGSAVLDEEPPDPYADENPAYMAAARTAVGSDAKANALKDAILECLREHGLVGGPAEDEDEPATDVGEGFDDY